MARPAPRSAAASPPIASDVYARRWWILAVLCTSLMIIIVGNTALNVAIPTLSKDLDATTSQLQWMVDAYSLVFAGMLFTGGAIGDRFGRKGALQFGLVVFLTGSLFAAFSDAAWAVIVGRVVMGFGAAFVMPATLSILANVFPPAERPKAIAIWAGISMAGAAIGPVASGFLLEHFWWGAVFLVNAPIVAAALVAGWYVLPTSRDPEQHKLDPIGAVLSIAGLSSLVYAIIEAPTHGWLSAQSAVWFGGAVVVLAGFLWWEMTAREPMLDLRFFRDRRFSVASGGMALTYFAMFGTLFLVTQYLQLVLGYSPLEAGLSQLPVAIVLIVVSPQTPRLSARVGSNRAVALGMVLAGLGLFLFSFVHVHTAYIWVVLPLIVMAAGMALTVSPMTASIMSAVPLGKAGVGSAMNDTTRELGGALGVAVLGSIVASKYNSELSSVIGTITNPVARGLANSGLAGALQVSREPGQTAVGPAAQHAFVSGMTVATRVGAIAAWVAAVIVYRLLPSLYPMRSRTPQTVAEDTLVTADQ
jgi:EmrB/QacA subfamily drug resistance transporter